MFVMVHEEDEETPFEETKRKTLMIMMCPLTRGVAGSRLRQIGKTLSTIWKRGGSEVTLVED